MLMWPKQVDKYKTFFIWHLIKEQTLSTLPTAVSLWPIGLENLQARSKVKLYGANKALVFLRVKVLERNLQCYIFHKFLSRQFQWIHKGHLSSLMTHGTFWSHVFVFGLACPRNLTRVAKILLYSFVFMTLCWQLLMINKSACNDLFNEWNGE